MSNSNIPDEILGNIRDELRMEEDYYDAELVVEKTKTGYFAIVIEGTTYSQSDLLDKGRSESELESSGIGEDDYGNLVDLFKFDENLNITGSLGIIVDRKFFDLEQKVADFKMANEPAPQKAKSVGKEKER